jgi:hypothetical protein
VEHLPQFLDLLFSTLLVVVVVAVALALPQAQPTLEMVVVEHMRQMELQELEDLVLSLFATPIHKL